MEGRKFLLSINSAKIKFGLERTEALLKECSNPEKNLLSVQIVGTNGKGSTSAMIAQSLTKLNFKVGHFTSPHLVDLKERIRINNQLISDDYINKFILKYKSSIKKIGASFFEIMSVMAVKYFSDNNVDIAILETGLGGKLDSITSMKSKGLIFTSISMDHMNILGDSLEQITQEKAGAITQYTKWVLSTKQQLSVQNILDKNAKIKNLNIEYIIKNSFFSNSNECFNLLGKHQMTNANLAALGVSQILSSFFKDSNKLFNPKDLLDTFWPGRIQKLSDKPDIIFDVAHNSEGIQALSDYISSVKNLYNKKYLIIGFESTKQIFGDLNELISIFDETIITETKIRNSMLAKEIYKSVNLKNKMTIDTNSYNAINFYKNKLTHSDLLVIAGSHYFGNVLNKIFKNCFENKSKD